MANGSKSVNNNYYGNMASHDQFVSHLITKFSPVQCTVGHRPTLLSTLRTSKSRHSEFSVFIKDLHAHAVGKFMNTDSDLQKGFQQSANMHCEHNFRV